MSYFIKFAYNDIGRGRLQLWISDTIIADIEARTGSINANGELVNAIRPGEWFINESPIDTINISMIWEGEGWYVPLYTPAGKRSSFGIHPDGGKTRRGDGTKGCIGTQGDALIFRDTIRKILCDIKQDEIRVIIFKTGGVE